MNALPGFLNLDQICLPAATLEWLDWIMLDIFGRDTSQMDGEVTLSASTNGSVWAIDFSPSFLD